MNENEITAIIIAIAIFVSAVPSLSGVERQLRRIADVLEKWDERERLK